MAELAQVEQLLRNIKAPVTQTDEGDFCIVYSQTPLKLANADVEHYLAAKANMERPVSPAICIPSWFEQAVEIQGHGRLSFRLLRNRDEIRMADKTHARQVILSPASTLFSLAQLDSEQIPRDVHRIMSFGLRFRGRADDEGTKPDPFNAILGRVLTVKVSTTPDDALARNWRKLQSIAEAALFHITYGQGVGFSLSFSWERVYYRLGLRRDSEVQFPLRTYVSELLAYYNLAFGSDSLILAYLALYKVLEYFFRGCPIGS